jgi:hypothetical protein
MRITSTLLSIAALLSTPSFAAQLILNGGFESGLSNWVVANQVGSDGSFGSQAGNTSPLTGSSVPTPPEGSLAAMSDAEGPGTHILYQDFLVPNSPDIFTLSFMLYLRNDAPDYFTPVPASIDFSIINPNQQFRVDILTASSDPFSISPSDVLQNVYHTQPGDPLVSGYRIITADLSAVFAGRAGQLLRLRFAATDNVFTFNAGVDNVSITDAPDTIVPEPSTMITGLFALGIVLAFGGVGRKRPWFLEIPSARSRQ